MSQKTKKLVYGAAFVAISVILGSFFSFYLTESIKITLAPLIVMFAGAALGPIWGAATGAVTDFLSYLIGGKAIAAYFPALTLTMALYGLLAGLFFYKRQNSLPKVAITTVLIQIGCSLLLNTLWLSLMMGTPYTVLMATRIPTSLISCAIYVVLLCLLMKNKDKIVRL